MSTPSLDVPTAEVGGGEAASPTKKPTNRVQAFLEDVHMQWWMPGYSPHVRIGVLAGVVAAVLLLFAACTYLVCRYWRRGKQGKATQQVAPVIQKGMAEKVLKKRAGKTLPLPCLGCGTCTFKLPFNELPEEPGAHIDNWPEWRPASITGAGEHHQLAVAGHATVFAKEVASDNGKIGTDNEPEPVATEAIAVNLRSRRTSQSVTTEVNTLVHSSADQEVNLPLGRQKRSTGDMSVEGVTIPCPSAAIFCKGGGCTLRTGNKEPPACSVDTLDFSLRNLMSIGSFSHLAQVRAHDPADRSTHDLRASTPDESASSSPQANSNTAPQSSNHCEDVWEQSPSRPVTFSLPRPGWGQPLAVASHGHCNSLYSFDFDNPVLRSGTDYNLEKALKEVVASSCGSLSSMVDDFLPTPRGGRPLSSLSMRSTQSSQGTLCTGVVGDWCTGGGLGERLGKEEEEVYKCRSPSIGGVNGEACLGRPVSRSSHYTALSEEATDEDLNWESWLHLEDTPPTASSPDRAREPDSRSQHSKTREDNSRSYPTGRPSITSPRQNSLTSAGTGHLHNLRLGLPQGPEPHASASGHTSRRVSVPGGRTSPLPPLGYPRKGLGGSEGGHVGGSHGALWEGDHSGSVRGAGRAVGARPPAVVLVPGSTSSGLVSPKGRPILKTVSENSY